MSSGGIEPKTIPRLAELVDHLAARSRQIEGAHPPAADLVTAAADRGYETDEDEAAWLSDREIWPARSTGRLVAVLELLEELGIPYQIAYDHVGGRAPAEITSVTINLKGD